MQWLKDYEHVEVDGMKLEHFWAPKLRIGKDEWDLDPDSLKIGDDSFVHLKRGDTSRSGFSRLVFAASNGSFERKSFNLTSSKGYDELIRLRNEALDNELKQATLSKLPKWQRDKVQVMRPKRRSSCDIKAGKSSSIAVTFGEGNIIVDMLKPGKATDDIWVKASLTHLSELIKFIVNSGMDDRNIRKYETSTLPKGCRRVKGDKILVRLPDEAIEAAKHDAKKWRKSVMVKTREEAEKVLEDPASYVCAEPDDNDEDAGDAACSNENDGAIEACPDEAPDSVQEGADEAHEEADFMMG